MADTLTPQQQADAHPVTPQVATGTRNMTANEFADMRGMILKVQDNTLQPVLREIINLIARANGLDPAEEDKRVADEAKKRADDQAKADKEQNDKDNAAADAKMAQAKKDMFIAMFGDSTSAPTASDTPPVDPNVAHAPDAKPLSQDQRTAMPDAGATTVGGVVTGPNVASVGEHGPETVTPAPAPKPAAPKTDPAAKA